MKHRTKRYCYGLLTISICHDGTNLSDCTWWASKNSRSEVLKFVKHYVDTHKDEVKSTDYYICDPDNNKWCNVNNVIRGVI